ncbi:MAG: hypothetical protein GY940_34190, partial [bacterium]|nr:hypothetical protein [bacterium]
MKKLITALTMLLILLVSTGAAGEQETDTSDKSVIKEIYRVYREGKFAKVLEMTEKAMASLGHNLDLIHAKYDALIKLRRFDDALGFIDEMIKKKGASEELVSAKYNVFMLQENFPEALKAAIQKDKIAKKKSPWDTINIMNVYLAMGSKEEALDTLQEAADRGFISYRILTGERY